MLPERKTQYRTPISRFAQAVDHVEGVPYTQFGTRASLEVVVLPTILPAPMRDLRSFDFTEAIDSPDAVITEARWSIAVSPDSRAPDPDVEERLIGEPQIGSTGQTTSHLVGDMIDQVVYLLTVEAHLTDGRVLVRRGSLVCMLEVTRPPLLRNGAVPFDYGLWLTRFPEFAETTPGQVEGFWENAGLIFRNDWSSPEPDPYIRQILLNLLTAHICALMGNPNYGGGGYGPQITGLINSKSVGSVSLSGSAFPGVTGTQAWYLTTKYGADFWKKTAAYRTFRYVYGPTRFPPYSWSISQTHPGWWPGII